MDDWQYYLALFKYSGIYAFALSTAGAYISILVAFGYFGFQRN